MAKMASKRAEYERREAFLRRGGAVDAASGVSGMYTQHTRTSSYPMNQRGVPRGGGGGQQQQHHNATGSGGGGGAAGGDGNNNLHRSKSEPRFEPNARTQPQRQSSRRAERSTGMGQPRYYKSNTVRTTAGEKQRASQPLPKRRSGYTSDTKDKYKNTTRTTSRGREGNKSSKDERRNSSKNERGRNNDNATNHKTGSDNNRQHRARSEPRRSRRRSREDRNGSGSGGGSGGSNSDANNNNSNNDRVRFETAAEPTYKKSSSNNNKHRSSGKDNTTNRQRARSAPARCGDKKDRFSSSRYNNNSSSRDKSNSSSNPESSSHPQEFYCPLTKRLMKDPVIDNDGNTYEREAIERWLRVQSSSPITNGHLSVDQLRPNRELKSKIHKVAGE